MAASWRPSVAINFLRGATKKWIQRSGVHLLVASIGIGGEMSFFSKLIDEVNICNKALKNKEMDLG